MARVKYRQNPRIVRVILDHQEQESKKPKPEYVPFWRVILSVVQASFGVQNERNRERDFKQGRLMAFIVAALIFTAVFVLVLMMIVRMVLNSQ